MFWVVFFKQSVLAYFIVLIVFNEVENRLEFFLGRSWAALPVEHVTAKESQNKSKCHNQRHPDRCSFKVVHKVEQDAYAQRCEKIGL